MGLRLPERKDVGRVKAWTRLGAAAAALVMFLTACVVPRSARLDCRVEEPKGVRAYFVEGKIVVEVSIDGKGPFGFLLDTGASICALDPWLDKELGATRDGRSTSYEVAGTVAHDLVRTKTLDMGPVHVERPVCNVLTEGSDAGQLWILQRIGARGVVGMELVASFVMVLNASLPSVEILREAPALDVPSLPLREGSLGLYEVRIEVDGTPLDLTIDTGDVAELSVSA
jgi:predicted aspartyl protease